MEKTLIIIKPDAVEKKCVGEIISIFENCELDIIQTEMMALSDEMLNDHYSHLTDKPFFPEIVEFMQMKELHSYNFIEEIPVISTILKEKIEEEHGT